MAPNNNSPSNTNEKSNANNLVAAYPSIPPPPSYEASTSVPAATVMAPALVTAGVTTSEGAIQFVTLPATRYDTMTSYQDDGTGAVQTVITTGIILDSPIMVKCPFCKATVTTETKTRAGCLSWLCCIGLSAVGCIYGCCLIPFCSKRLCDVQHTCPKCQNVIALYKRL